MTQKYIIKIVILYIITFTFGFIVGYFFSKEKIISYLLNFSPTPDFLSMIAAFEAVVVAIAIPLSIEIASRISERYQSQVITKSFTKIWEVKYLPCLIIFLISLTIGLRFFINNIPISITAKIFSWIALIGFLIVAIIFIIFLNKLKLHITEIKYILDGLFDEAEELLE